ncbi:MAG TPA: ABC transporter substrate-binding protein [Candidatus Binatia bacterium]|nr:ABC transporter substrate-binding protein [Candidatus Binatia bacterium]
MQRRASWVTMVAGLSVLLAANGFAAERGAKLAPVRIGVVSRSTLDMPYYVARDRGFFRDEGLDAEIVLVRSSLSVQALLGGSIDFATATGTAVNAVVSGADVRVVFAMTDRPSFDLIAHPSIGTIQQLRAHKIGYGGIGGLSETIVHNILLVNRIPLNQVTFLPLNASDLTYPSLKAGVIDAAMLQIPPTFRAQDEGFRKLASGGDYYRVVQGGLTTTRATFNQRPNVLLRMIRATMRAVRLIKGDRKYALDFMKGPYLELGKESEGFVERIYDAAADGYLMNGAVDENLQREMIATAARRAQPAPSLPPQRVFDFTLALKAAEGLR